jgi:hypothetical protein
MARGARRRKVRGNRHEEGTVNIGLVVTLVIVLAGLAFILYGVVRPFTHVHHDHRDVFHPPHLD